MDIVAVLTKVVQDQQARMGILTFPQTSSTGHPQASRRRIRLQVPSIAGTPGFSMSVAARSRQSARDTLVIAGPAGTIGGMPLTEQVVSSGGSVMVVVDVKDSATGAYVSKSSTWVASSSRNWRRPARRDRTRLHGTRRTRTGRNSDRASTSTFWNRAGTSWWINWRWCGDEKSRIGLAVYGLLHSLENHSFL